MRVFAAIPIPDAIAEQLASWTQPYKKERLFRKWTHPHDYHITLQFLGETPQEKIKTLKAALKRVKSGPLTLSLNRAGSFGQPQAPRVLWAAVAGDTAGLTALHAAVIEETRTIGYVPEDRPYSPHITIARKFIGGGGMPDGLLSAAPAGASWVADRFVLMRTHLHESPMYEIMDEYRLAVD